VLTWGGRRDLLDLRFRGPGGTGKEESADLPAAVTKMEAAAVAGAGMSPRAAVGARGRWHKTQLGRAAGSKRAAGTDEVPPYHTPAGLSGWEMCDFEGAVTSTGSEEGGGGAVGLQHELQQSGFGDEQVGWDPGVAHPHATG
jgi:hypothetical protein